MKRVPNAPVISIVGSESLLGREIRDVLSAQGLDRGVRLVSGDVEPGGLLTDEEGDAALITTLESATLVGSQLAFLAGSRASSRKAFELLTAGGDTPAIIDLSYALEELPIARLRAPLAEPPGWEPEQPASVHVVAHPAAIALAMFLRRLHKAHPIRTSVAQILEPASERGQAGLTELQQQTVSLLSFKSIPKELFDAQLSFNLLPRYGTEAKEPLEEIELRVDRHLATLLSVSEQIPMPSLRLIQAPVFHGHSLSVWVEFEERPASQELAEALATAQIEVRAADEEPPTNVGATGQSGITVGIEADRNHPRAAWIWMVADNFRISAENAVEMARRLLPQEESA